MKIKFEENTVYHTETKEEFDFILNEMKSQGLGGLNADFSSYNELTCIRPIPSKGFLNHSYAHLVYYKKEGFKIVKVKELMGLLIKNNDYIQCFNRTHMQGCIDKLRDLGYKVYENISGTDFDNFPFLQFEDGQFIASTLNVGKELFLSKLPSVKKLPKINGYTGVVKEDHLEYGCTKLPLSWFKDSFNRRIKSMVLSNGVEISESDMIKIREYLNK